MTPQKWKPGPYVELSQQPNPRSQHQLLWENHLSFLDIKVVKWNSGPFLTVPIKLLLSVNGMKLPVSPTKNPSTASLFHSHIHSPYRFLYVFSLFNFSIYREKVDLVNSFWPHALQIIPWCYGMQQLPPCYLSGNVS